MELRDGQRWGRVPSTSDLRSLLTETEIECRGEGRGRDGKWGGEGGLMEEGHTLHPSPCGQWAPRAWGGQRGAGSDARAPWEAQRQRGERRRHRDTFGIRDTHREGAGESLAETGRALSASETQSDIRIIHD